MGAKKRKLKMVDKDEEKASTAETNAGSKTFSSATFHSLGLAESLADHLHGNMSFTAPTHIQQEAIPLILSGQDVLVNAETGTGKTIAYLAPIVDALQKHPRRVTREDGTLALVLVPSRELCFQVYAVVEKLVHRFIWLVPGFIMGGENRSKEKARLRKGITILVATPGRLLDHLNNTLSFKHDNLRWLVFDEADRLLDLGFDKDIRSILNFLGERGSTASITDEKRLWSKGQKRQHILLSATLNEHVNELAALSLKDAATVGVMKGKGTADMIEQELASADKHTEYNVPTQLKQFYLKVPCKLRMVALMALIHQKLTEDNASKLVIFLSTCDAVDFYHKAIEHMKGTHFLTARDKDGHSCHCPVFSLHGSRPQKDRTETFHKFDKASSALLICTDVAARGLDFHGVTCIVQYDPPGDAAEYVHRVGRTARLGKHGEAVLFLQPIEVAYIAELKNHAVSLEELPLQPLLDGLPTNGKKQKEHESWRAIETHPAVFSLHTTLEAYVSQKDMKELAVDAFRSYIRAYAAHKGDLKPIFQVHKLHLGHVAKSFGLKEAPKLFGTSRNKEILKKHQAQQKVVHAARESKRLRLHAASMEE